MKKSIFLLFSIFSLIMVVLLLPSTASAKTYRYWYSDSNRIGYVNNKNIWSNNLRGGFKDSDFINYYNYARNQWSNAGISTYGVNSKSSSIIHWYAGSKKDLESLEPNLRYYAALTVVSHVPSSTGKYKNKTIYNKRITSSRIYTPKKLLYTKKKYKTMFTHELGHALGYLGHSTSKSDLMDAGASTDKLTNRDKNHLRQNY